MLGQTYQRMQYPKRMLISGFLRLGCAAWIGTSMALPITKKVYEDSKTVHITLRS